MKGTAKTDAYIVGTPQWTTSYSPNATSAYYYDIQPNMLETRHFNSLPPVQGAGKGKTRRERDVITILNYYGYTGWDAIQSFATLLKDFREVDECMLVHENAGTPHMNMIRVVGFDCSDEEENDAGTFQVVIDQIFEPGTKPRQYVYEIEDFVVQSVSET